MNPPGRPPQAQADREALRSLAATPGVARLFAALDGDGEALRMVGGAVRDALLGHAVHDVDFTTTATPDEIIRRARRAGLGHAPTGIAHGTVTVIVDGAPFEVTTLREDVETDGRHAQVRFGRDFDADAFRRDFTINAMSADRNGQLHDPVGGLADLRPPHGAPFGAPPRVRFIGDASARIREDYLRALRFFRFHARFGEGAPPEAEAFSAIIACRDGLAGLSRERVRAEMFRLLDAPGAAEALTLMSGAGLLLVLTGMVVEPGRVARLAAHEAAIGAGPDAVLRLAAAAVRIPEDADHLEKALRLSGAEARRLRDVAKALTRLRSLPIGAGVGAMRALAADLGARALVDALAVARGDARPQLDDDASAWCEALARGEVSAPVFPLRGADLLAIGAPAGPTLGVLLGALRASWLAEGCPEGEHARALLLDEAQQRLAARS